MKFILLVTAAVLVAGGGTFLLTGQQPVAATPASLAGDWRCNTLTNGGPQRLEANLLVSIGADGATKGLGLFNSKVQGHTVTLEASFTGSTRVADGQLHETTTNFAITEASVDGEQAPADLRAELREGLFTEASTYDVSEFSKSRLVYANENGRITCERSPVPLNL
jgi:hypothetical protein